MNLYAISDGTHIKIGVSGNVNSRLSTLQVGNTRPLYIVLKLNCRAEDAAYKLESILHKRYAESRISGEWFAITEETLTADLQFLKDSFPALLSIMDQEQVRQAVLKEMSKEEIHDYIEHRWPKPVSPSPLGPPEDYLDMEYLARCGIITRSEREKQRLQRK